LKIQKYQAHHFSHLYATDWTSYCFRSTSYCFTVTSNCLAQKQSTVGKNRLKTVDCFEKKKNFFLNLFFEKWKQKICESDKKNVVYEQKNNFFQETKLFFPTSVFFWFVFSFFEAISLTEQQQAISLTEQLQATT
jgi:hypothetical protein